MDVLSTWRIVLLGKSGVGKSSLANTIFGEAKFKVKRLNDMETHCSPAETKYINGRSITLIDTPGFFDPGRTEEELKPEMVSCITECAPGPHAFIIVLKVERFTEHEKAVITQICEYFSEDALKYAVVVFTHGDQLPEGMKMEEYVQQSEGLSNLVKKCEGRCHVVDNKYWKTDTEDDYRSNQFQVEEILHTINEMVMENNGDYYTNEKLQELEREIQKEEERIRRASGNMSQEEVRVKAKSNVLKKLVDKAGPPWVGGLLGFAIIAGLLAATLAVLFKVVKETPLFSEELTAMVDVVEQQAENVVEASSPVSTISQVGEVLTEQAQALVDMVGKQAENVVEVSSPASTISQVGEVLTEQAKALVEGVEKQAENVVEGSSPASIITQVGEVLTEQAKALVEVAEKQAENVVEGSSPASIITQVGEVLTEQAKAMVEVAEKQAETALGVSSPDSTITGVMEVLATPVTVIKKAFEVILDKLYALYESTYDPWNPFE